MRTKSLPYTLISKQIQAQLFCWVQAVLWTVENFSPLHWPFASSLLVPTSHSLLLSTVPFYKCKDLFKVFWGNFIIFDLIFFTFYFSFIDIYSFPWEVFLRLSHSPTKFTSFANASQCNLGKKSGRGSRELLFFHSPTPPRVTETLLCNLQM